MGWCDSVRAAGKRNSCASGTRSARRCPLLRLRRACSKKLLLVLGTMFLASLLRAQESLGLEVRSKNIPLTAIANPKAKAKAKVKAKARPEPEAARPAPKRRGRN